VLKWARANGAPWDRNTCANAAGGGHLELLKWAYANGAPLDTLAWDLAAKCGKLPVLRWAQQIGDTRWLADACLQATVGGQLDVLQWAKANGANWNKRELAQAAWREEVRMWIEEQTSE